MATLLGQLLECFYYQCCNITCELAFGKILQQFGDTEGFLKYDDTRISVSSTRLSEIMFRRSVFVSWSLEQRWSYIVGGHFVQISEAYGPLVLQS